MTNEEIRDAVIKAVREAHVCQKEEEIAELTATCHRITDFGNELRDNNSKLSLALEKLAIGDERLKTIRDMLENNERDHREIGKRLSNLGRIVEHEHAPIIANLKGVGKFFKAILLTIVTVLLLGTGAFVMNQWAEHKAQLGTLTTGRP